MSARQLALQEWLMETDPVYKENHFATLKFNAGCKHDLTYVHRHQYRSAINRAIKDGRLKKREEV